MTSLDSIAASSAMTLAQATQLYALKNADGQYLHHSLTRLDDGSLRMTEVKQWRWAGKLSQLDAVRRLHPETRTMATVKLPAPRRDEEVYK